MLLVFRGGMPTNSKKIAPPKMPDSVSAILCEIRVNAEIPKIPCINGTAGYKGQKIKYLGPTLVDEILENNKERKTGV